MKWALIFKNELNSFLKSDKSLFIVNIILVIAWGALFASNFRDINSEMGTVWLLFFSVIVSSNFSNATFISERMNGMLELLLVSGIPRRDILLGKVLFVTLLSIIMGMLVYLFALLVNKYFSSPLPNGNIDIFKVLFKALPIYISACILNISAASWLSVKLSNPRILHFINLLMLVSFAFVKMFVGQLMFFSDTVFTAVLLIGGIVFYNLALKEYRSENVTKPLIF